MLQIKPADNLPLICRNTAKRKNFLSYQHMAQRTSIKKKIRFEVFKRDKFTCQYCGRKAPDIVLEVDHIHPVAEGGANI